jgi:hypothetical protein
MAEAFWARGLLQPNSTNYLVLRDTESSRPYESPNPPVATRRLRQRIGVGCQSMATSHAAVRDGVSCGIVSCDWSGEAHVWTL